MYFCAIGYVFSALKLSTKTEQQHIIIAVNHREIGKLEVKAAKTR